MSVETRLIYAENTFRNFIKPSRDGHAEVFDFPAGPAEVLTGACKKREEKTSSVLQCLMTARKRLSSPDSATSSVVQKKKKSN